MATKAKTKRLTGKARTAEILRILDVTYPNVTCALHHNNAWELLVATILSAQCTDKRVNLVTPVLFARYRTAADYAAAAREDIEKIVQSTGFFRAKTTSILGLGQALCERFGGEVPGNLRDLVTLPGVGRKTANVVLGHAFGVNEGIAVDTHVLRVTNRLGLAKGDDPLKVEAQLNALVPQDRWTRTPDLLIFHGRKICDARRPRCGDCPLFDLCRWPDRRGWAAKLQPKR